MPNLFERMGGMFRGHEHKEEKPSDYEIEASPEKRDPGRLERLANAKRHLQEIINTVDSTPNIPKPERGV